MSASARAASATRGRTSARLLQAAHPGRNRCEPYQHDVVAVRDGAVLRAPSQEALYIVVNAPNERIRFRYLHMLPRQFDADGMVSGRFVREGEVIGKVGNFFKRERATTYHLHFDAQVPTKYGWVFVNPYMTLVAAYERLIQGRGQEIREDTTDDVPTGSTPAEPAAGGPESAGDRGRKADRNGCKPGRQGNPIPGRGAMNDGKLSVVTASLPADAGRRNGGMDHRGARRAA